MKRSELYEKLHDYLQRHSTTMDSGDTANLLALIEDALSPAWSPEEPEGFEAFWLDPAMDGLRVVANRHACLAAWNACLAHQGATKEPWHAGMSFDEIRLAIQQGVAPGSREPGGYVTVPREYFSWLAFQVRHDEARRRARQELLALADGLEGRGQQTRPLSRAEIAEAIRSILRLPE